MLSISGERLMSVYGDMKIVSTSQASTVKVLLGKQAGITLREVIQELRVTAEVKELS